MKTKTVCEAEPLRRRRGDALGLLWNAWAVTSNHTCGAWTHTSSCSSAGRSSPCHWAEATPLEASGDSHWSCPACSPWFLAVPPPSQPEAQHGLSHHDPWPVTPSGPLNLPNMRALEVPAPLADAPLSVWGVLMNACVRGTWGQSLTGPQNVSYVV